MRAYVGSEYDGSCPAGELFSPDDIAQLTIFNRAYTFARFAIMVMPMTF